VMRALDDQVRLGKVFYLGISDTPAWVVAQMQTLAAERGWSTFAGLQVEYSLVQREVERELIPMARGLGLGVLAWGPLGAGVLSGKYANPETPAAGRRLADVDPGRLAIARAVADIADGLGLSSSVVALAWIRAQGGVIQRRLHPRWHVRPARPAPGPVSSRLSTASATSSYVRATAVQ
jgi:aryl-alcohol dehydrogenase-like predicted oxidoreductase